MERLSPARVTASQARAGRPNFIIVLTDDLDQQLGSLEYMPQVQDLLVKQGLTFSNFLVNVSLCCPSRTSLLRGQYVHNHGIYSNGLPTGGFEKAFAEGMENNTLATVLQSAGYRTGLAGKYLNGYPYDATMTYIPPGWDEWYSPVEGGPYNGFNYQMNENGRVYSYGSGPQDYATDVLASKASGFIQRSAASGKPFFLYLATYAPHWPAIPAPRHAQLFTGVQAPRTPSFNEADLSDKPVNRALLTPTEINAIDNLYRNRLRTLQAVDEMVASLYQALAASGQLDNTYILFTSDNGFHLGQHRLLPGKGTMYEEDIRVPLVVRGPGVPPGQSTDALTAMIDLAPTLLDLAEAAIPAYTDGRSLRHFLQGGPPAPWRQAFLLEMYPDHNGRGSPPENFETIGAGLPGALEPLDPGDAPALSSGAENEGVSSTAPEPRWLAIRTERYKFIERENGSRELYDLQADSDEMENIYSAAPAGLIALLGDWLYLLYHCAAVTCRLAENAPPAAVTGVVRDAQSGWPLYAQVSTDLVSFPPAWSDPVSGAYRLVLPTKAAYALKVQAWSLGYLPTVSVIGALTENAERDFGLSPDLSTCSAPGYRRDPSSGVCTLQKGGLVSGFVSDANTREPLDGAILTNGVFSTTSQATPFDASLAGGLYSLFLPDGSQTLTATYSLSYSLETSEIHLPLYGSLRQDFSLKAGWIQPQPKQANLTLEPGGRGSLTLTLANKGSLPADFQIADAKLPWLAISPMQGSLSPGKRMKIQLLFDASGLSRRGVYIGTLVIENNTPYPAEVFPVQLTLPFLHYLPFLWR